MSSDPSLQTGKMAILLGETIAGRGEDNAGKTSYSMP